MLILFSISFNKVNFGVYVSSEISICSKLMVLILRSFAVETCSRDRKERCRVEETPIGVTDASGRFDFEGKTPFAPAVMEDLFKNWMK